MSRFVCHLFVYGTLLHDHPTHRLLGPGAERVGVASVQGRLYDLGAYPGLKPGGGPRDRVIGEVYRLHDTRRLLARLDRYEGCRAGDYRRVLRTVRLKDDGHVRAWVYLYRGSVTGRARIPSGAYRPTPSRSRRRLW